MAEQRTVMLTGRIVWTAGDLFKGKQKFDDRTRQPVLDKTGQPVTEYGFGLAVPKTDFQQGKPGWPMWVAMHEEAYGVFPSRQIPPSFAWKYKDGDGVDHNGASFAQRQGYAGCFVFTLTTRLPLKWFRNEGGAVTLTNEGIKCGDYVQVQVSVKGHAADSGPNSKPGLYLNPYAVLFVGYGPEIINTPSGEQIFGTSAPVLPPGASATPIAPTGGGFLVSPSQAPGAAPVAPQFQAPPVPGMAQPQYQQQPSYPNQAPAPVQPHYGVLPQVHQPQGFQAPSPAAFAGPQAAPAAPFPQGAPAMPQAPQFPGQPAVPGYPGFQQS